MTEDQWTRKGSERALHRAGGRRERRWERMKNDGKMEGGREGREE